MDVYCPHLGANLALGGRVEGCNLVCPYHWWEYDGDGRNVRIPYSDRTNAKARVRTYPTVDVNGFVMFWYHPDPQQPPLLGDPRPAPSTRTDDVDRADRRRTGTCGARGRSSRRTGPTSCT